MWIEQMRVVAPVEGAASVVAGFADCATRTNVPVRITVDTVATDPLAVIAFESWIGSQSEKERTV